MLSKIDGAEPQKGKPRFRIPVLLLLLSLPPLALCALAPHPVSAGGTVSAELVPLECNEDGTYYPGDTFAVNYTVTLPPGGVYYDRNGRPCQYYYALTRVYVYGDHIYGGTSSTAIGSVVCTVSTSAPPGEADVVVEAYGTYNHQYWTNETYFWYEYDNATGMYVERTGWRWEVYWSATPVTWSTVRRVEVVAYDPHFTVFAYPIYSGGAETTYRAPISVLVRYDGNGPSLNLRQRAVLDSHSSSAVGRATFIFSSQEETKEAVQRGFYSLKPATLEDLASSEDLAALGSYASPSLLRAVINSSAGTIYVGEKRLPGYEPEPGSPLSSRSPTVLSGGKRYARFVFVPASPASAEAETEILNASISLWWSRFGPSDRCSTSVEIPNISLLCTLYVRLYVPGAADQSVESLPPATASVLVPAEGDFLAAPLLQDPPEGIEGDEEMFRQWALDNWGGSTSPEDYATLPPGAVLSSGPVGAPLKVPRTASCTYNLSISGPPGEGSPNGWVKLSLAIQFLTAPPEPVTVFVNVAPSAVRTDFRSYLAYCWAAIKTEEVALKSVRVFSAAGDTWKVFEWLPEYTERNGRLYELWFFKPKSLSESTTVYAEITDVWGNSQTLALGEAGPYVEGIYDIPYSSIFLAMGMVGASGVIYELLRRVIERL